MGFIEWVKELFNSEKKPKPKTKEELQAEENARLKAEIELLKVEKTKYSKVIKVEKDKEVIKDLGLEGKEGKPLMQEDMKKILGMIGELKDKDLERENEIKTLKADKIENANKVKALEEKDIKKDNEIKALKVGAESLRGFITISLAEMKNIASTAKDAIHTANFFKTNLLKIIDKQIGMNNNIHEEKKCRVSPEITEYNKHKSQAIESKFKLENDIQDIKGFITSGINVKYNVEQKRNLENQVAQYNSEILKCDKAISKIKKNWETFDNNITTENNELQKLKEEVLNTNIAAIEQVDEIINKMEKLHKNIFRLPENDIMFDTASKQIEVY